LRGCSPGGENCAGVACLLAGLGRQGEKNEEELEDPDKYCGQEAAWFPQ